jgi:hypothetical protein
MAKPEVWHAIVKLAGNLKFGRNDGHEACSIIQQALKGGGGSVSMKMNSW